MEQNIVVIDKKSEPPGLLTVSPEGGKGVYRDLLYHQPLNPEYPGLHLYHVDAQGVKKCLYSACLEGGMYRFTAGEETHIFNSRHELLTAGLTHLFEAEGKVPLPVE